MCDVARHILVIACSVACVSASAQPGSPVPAPVVSAGDTWTFRFEDLGPRKTSRELRYRVDNVSPAEIRVVVEGKPGERTSSATFTPHMNAVAVGPARFTPEFSRLRFPLHV